MKIATWNVERLRHKKELEEILSACERSQADILVLTETDSQVRPNYQYCFQTPSLVEIEPAAYRPTENRVSIFTNYKCLQQHTTFNKYTAICVELETEMGNLLVYGTIIGIYGNRHPSFQQDLSRQLADFRRLSASGHNLCVCGDFNCTFSDNYYYTERGRAAILQSFAENQIELLTRVRSECIDHIAITGGFLRGTSLQIEEWNLDKTLSDHKGIVISFTG